MRYKKLFILIGVILVIYISFRFLAPQMIPLLVAGFVAIVYYPVLHKIFGKRNIWNSRRKKWLLIFAVILFYIVLGIGVGSLLYFLFCQGRGVWLNFPFYEVRINNALYDCGCIADDYLHLQKGVCYSYLQGVCHNIVNKDWTNMLPRVTSLSVQMLERIFVFVFETVVTVIMTVFLMMDYEELRDRLMKREWGLKICQGIKMGKTALAGYLKAQICILLLDSVVCIIAFWMIHNPYAWLLGPLVALVDALPIFGIGLVLLPYALWFLISGKFLYGGILLVAYICCVVLRQTVEPKFVGGKIGLRPLYTIASMYVGVRLFGILGFLFGPMGVILGKELYELLANIGE